MLVSRQLRYFLAVAQHLHFGRASDQLEIAQSALSRHVKELEKYLGVRLLNRGRRSTISLTEPGKALLSDATHGVRQLDRAILAAQQTARGETGRISLGYVTSASLTGVLPRALERYRVRHGGVAVQVTAMDTPSQLAALHEGVLDLGFLRPRTVYPPGIVAHVVHRESMLLALAANHPLAAKRFDLTHLATETFIIPQFDENTGFAEQLSQLAAGGGFEPRNTLHVQDFLTAITLAAGGYGVVPVPRCFLLSIHMRNLVFRTIQGYRATAELAVAYNLRSAPEAARAFIRETRSRRGHALKRSVATRSNSTRAFGGGGHF